MQNAGKIYSGGTGANDGYPVTFESAQIFVIGAVGENFLRQIAEHRRNKTEVSNAGGNHDPLAADDFPALSGELKAIRNWHDRCYGSLFESTYETALKFETVGYKGFDGNGKTHVRIRKGM